MICHFGKHLVKIFKRGYNGIIIGFARVEHKPLSDIAIGKKPGDTYAVDCSDRVSLVTRVILMIFFVSFTMTTKYENVHTYESCVLFIAGSLVGMASVKCRDADDQLPTMFPQIRP